MKKNRKFYQDNLIYVIFSFLLTFFLICSYVFGYKEGFASGIHLFFILMFALLLTPITCFAITCISKIKFKSHDFASNHWLHLFEHQWFYLVVIFLLQLPVFLAFYPGICYYDIGTQIEQYESCYFVLNHPLLHTLYLGALKNISGNANTGYAIATLIQMIIVDSAMAYTLSYLFSQRKNIELSILGILFYGLFPVNSLLAISSTKDILFAAFTLIFFVDLLQMLHNKNIGRYFLLRFMINTVLLLLFRNNAIYAFLPTAIILLIIQSSHKDNFKKYLIYFLTTLFFYFAINGGLTYLLHAVPGSIKETMSIPSQQLARIYLNTDNEETKTSIQAYIPDPERYCYYLSDAIKEQLDFDTLDSSCKHFLLDTAIYDLQNPVTALNAAFYNVQGYWDIFHTPYQSDHFFLATDDYRGGAVLDSKIPALAQLFIKLFNKTDIYPITIFLGTGIYIWLFLWSLIKAIKEKNRPYYCSCLFPLFYLLTLLLGPGAIIRYSFIFILLFPITLLFGSASSTCKLQ